MRNIDSQNDGFTLIEVVVAMVVLTIGIFALAGMQTAAIQGNYKANQLTTASLIAQNKIEELLAADFDGNDLREGTHTGESLIKESVYVVTWKSTAVRDNTAMAIIGRTLLVTVSWRDESVSMEIYRAQN